MKKIFTFLVFAGLAGSALAQDSRSAHYRDQPNNGGQSSGYTKDNTNGYNNGYTAANGYNGNYQHDRNNGNAYGYNNESNYRGRNDERDFRGRYPVYRAERGYAFDRWAPFSRYNRRHAWFRRQSRW